MPGLTSDILPRIQKVVGEWCITAITQDAVQRDVKSMTQEVVQEAMQDFVQYVSPGESPVFTPDGCPLMRLHVLPRILHRGNHSVQP